jgi:hypothetical protein
MRGFFDNQPALPRGPGAPHGGSIIGAAPNGAAPKRA